MSLLAQSWEWAVGGKGYDSFDYSYSVATDHDGNVYVAGHFQSQTLTFGNKKINNAGKEDIYVAKFDSKGNCLWNVGFGGQENERATCMVLGKSSLIVAGFFESKPATFGDKSANAVSGSEIFIVFLDPNTGNVQKLYMFGGDGYDDPNSIFVDDFDNIYLSGEFSGDFLVVGTDTLKNFNYGTTYKGMGDGFVVKISPDANIEWAKSFGGVSNDRVNSVVVDREGMVYFYGTYNSPYLELADSVLNKGFSDIFLFKYDQRNNKLLWKLYIAGTDKEYAASIAIGHDSCIYLTGEFQSEVLKFRDDSLINKGSYDFFILKLSKEGDILKSRSFGNYADEYAKKTVFDKEGNFYIGGYFASPVINLDNLALLNSTTDQYSDIFAAKFDRFLNPIWVQTAGGKGEDQSFSIAVDYTGNVYQVGNFESREIFFNKRSIFNFGYSNIFLAKLNPNIPANVEYHSVEYTPILIYPNPCDDFLLLLSDNNNLPKTCKIFDILGNEIIEFTLKEGTILDVGFLESGIYFLQFEGRMFSFVKMR